MMADFHFWWVPLLAETSGGGGVSGEIVVAIITAIFTGLGGLFLGKKVEKDAQKNEVEIKGQPVRVSKDSPVVTWSDHVNLVRRVDRVDQHLDSMRREQSEQFKDLLEAASTRESRIIDKIDATARAIHSRMDNWKGGGK